MDADAGADALDEIAGASDGAGHSTRLWPVVATLVVVLGEAVALGAAAYSSGSAVLFAEAAQSLAGAGVELFLLVGTRRSRRPADELHPIGYGREAFFWSLIASLGIFVGGGAVSIGYGLFALRHPGSESAYTLGYVLLAVIVVADGITLVAALRPIRHSVAGRRSGLRRGLRRTSDAAARTLVFDNAAAVLGGVVGILGLAAHQVTGDARADAVASLVIGVLLLATTVVLLRVNRELLTDQSVAVDVREAMRARIRAQDGVVDVPELLVVYTGPLTVLVAGEVRLDARLSADQVAQALLDVRTRLCSQWPGDLRVYLSPVDGG